MDAILAADAAAVVLERRGPAGAGLVVFLLHAARIFLR
jgi:hypothetical protein